MREVKTDYPFFEYFEKHFSWQKGNFVNTKTPSKDIPPKKARQKAEKPVSPPKVNVLEAYLSSSSSTGPSSDKDPLEDYIQLPPVDPENDPLEAYAPFPPKKWKSKYRGNPAFKDFHRKKIVAKEYRRQKLFKNNDFYKKGNPNPIKNLKPKAKGKCFKCGKKGHFKKECLGKTPTHSAVSEEISKALEFDQESPESSTAKESIPKTDSCCKNNTIEVLSKQEELLLDLIEQIKDPEEKVQRLSEFHRTLVKEASTSKPRIPEPNVDLEKIYNRFTRSKKDVTIQDLQKEIKDTKTEMRNLKQELTILRVDHGLMNLRVKNLEVTSHQGDEETPSLNPSDVEGDETVNPTAEMEPEPSNGTFLQTINRINFQKWHSKEIGRAHV